MQYTMSWVDIAFLGILLLSVIVGLMRGVIFEVLSLLGWLAAYLAAQWFAPDVAPHLPVGSPGSALNHAAAFASIFLFVLIVWGVLARLLRMLIRATPLSGADRLLGAAFGFARGCVVLLVVSTFVMLTSLAKSPAWKESRGAVWSADALHRLKPMLPPQIAQHLPR